MNCPFCPVWEWIKEKFAWVTRNKTKAILIAMGVIVFLFSIKQLREYLYYEVGMPSKIIIYSLLGGILAIIFQVCIKDEQKFIKSAFLIGIFLCSSLLNFVIMQEEKINMLISSTESLELIVKIGDESTRLLKDGACYPPLNVGQPEDITQVPFPSYKKGLRFYIKQENLLAIAAYQKALKELEKFSPLKEYEEASDEIKKKVLDAKMARKYYYEGAIRLNLGLAYNAIKDKRKEAENAFNASITAFEKVAHQCNGLLESEQNKLKILNSNISKDFKGDIRPYNNLILLQDDLGITKNLFDKAVKIKEIDIVPYYCFFAVCRKKIQKDSHEIEKIKEALNALKTEAENKYEKFIQEEYADDFSEFSLKVDVVLSNL